MLLCRHGTLLCTQVAIVCVPVIIGVALIVC